MVTTANEVRDCLIRQVTGAVRWVDCMKTLIGEGTQLFIELAPGTVLCGLLKQIDPAQKPGLNVEDIASLEKTLSELKAAHSA
jgi:[acyl-carrier-protein] S-malonyltransferase